MFFGAYLGDGENLASWQNTMQQHASWLGLTPTVETLKLSNGQYFSFGWLKATLSTRKPSLEDSKDYLVITTSGDITFEDSTLEPQLVTDRGTNVIKLGLSCQSGELQIIVPPATPEQFYFTRDQRGYTFGNDMRLLMRWARGDYDERAIYALFQYGAIPAPLTMSKNVQRIPNGHILKLKPKATEPTLEAFFQPGRETPKDKPLASPEERVGEALDTVLARVPASATVYFSGGVDSTLMASRLVNMGRTDIKLINFAFGPEDPEGQLALQMAEHLKLPCEQVMYDASQIPSMLGRMGQDYSFPFGDHSVIPTNLLVHASLPTVESSLTVIEGTGADGAFGRWGTESRVASLPNPFRWLLSTGYKGLKSWQTTSEFERIGGLARGSLQMPLAHQIVIAQNLLNGIAYTIPGKTGKALEETIKTRIENLSKGLKIKEQYSLLDLIHVCAGIFAAKSFDPLRAQGVNPIYPFLEPPMVSLSLSLPYETKCAGGQSKALLKSLLAQSVPPELVYRRKSGFIPPFQKILTYPSLQTFVREVVLSPQNPLLNFCQMGTVKPMLERAQQGQSLSIGARRFLWVLIFTSGWLQQLPKP